MNVLDLFSGIGGFSLGLERAGMRTVAFCEENDFCRRVLAKHWPHVPCFDDVRTLGADRIAADVVCGGFPCQDISLAGPGEGIDGKRSGLWSEYARIVGEVRPAYVVVENVAALLGRGLGRVLGDLAALGYDAEWDCFPTGLNFGHLRERIWIVAHDSRPRLPQRRSAKPHRINAPRIFTRERFACVLEAADPAQKWADRPLLGRGVHGIPDRVDRVHSVGNALNPEIPEIIGRAIMTAANLKSAKQ